MRHHGNALSTSRTSGRLAAPRAAQAIRRRRRGASPGPAARPAPGRPPPPAPCQRPEGPAGCAGGAGRAGPGWGGAVPGWGPGMSWGRRRRLRAAVAPIPSMTQTRSSPAGTVAAAEARAWRASSARYSRGVTDMVSPSTRPWEGRTRGALPDQERSGAAPSAAASAVVISGSSTSPGRWVAGPVTMVVHPCLTEPWGLVVPAGRMPSCGPGSSPSATEATMTRTPPGTFSTQLRTSSISFSCW